MDRRAWWATVCEVTKSQTRLSMHTYMPDRSFEHRKCPHGVSDHLPEGQCGEAYHPVPSILELEFTSQMPQSSSSDP